MYPWRYKDDDEQVRGRLNSRWPKIKLLPNLIVTFRRVLLQPFELRLESESQRNQHCLERQGRQVPKQNRRNPAKYSQGKGGQHQVKLGNKVHEGKSGNRVDQAESTKVHRRRVPCHPHSIYQFLWLLQWES